MQTRLGRSMWLLVAVALVAVMLGAVALSGCGGGGDSPATTASPAGSTATTGTASAAGGQGEAVAKEMLATFDELVGKVAALANAKPEPATVKPQLEELYASYEPKMAELNTKYLALRDSDVSQFGACNTYLGNFRGQHVTQKDNTLTPALQYYNLELGDQEMVKLISQKPVDLLEIAVKQN
jgi:hypothetical protein